MEVTESFLKLLYEKRKELYLKGGNDELLNDKIRELQELTSYKVKDE